MLCKNFLIDSVDFTSYAHKNGLHVYKNPKFLSQNLFTLDGTEHVIELPEKTTYIIDLNPLTETQAATILSAYNNGSFLTIYDPEEEDDVVILYKKSQVKSEIPMSKGGSVVKWSVGSLTFTER